MGDESLLRLPIEQALALGFSIAVSVSQLKTCEEVNGIPGCEEKWCPRCGCHFGDCDCIGVCESEDDYESESLFSVKRLVEAELLDDFLDQAEHLLEAGYYQPAAVVAGCVLEDGLHKLCQANAVVMPDHPKLDWMNSELVKKGTYTKLVQKRITSIADLRNNAAHGRWTEFDKSDVEAMLRDIRDFMTKHYA